MFRLNSIEARAVIFHRQFAVKSNSYWYRSNEVELQCTTKKRARSFTSFDDKLQSSCNYFELLEYAHSCAMPEIVVIITQLLRLCLHQWALACRSVFHSIQFRLPSSSVRIRVNSKASFLNHLRDFFFFLSFFIFVFGCVKWNLSSHSVVVGGELSARGWRANRVQYPREWERHKVGREEKNSRGFTLLIFFPSFSDHPEFV